MTVTVLLRSRGVAMGYHVSFHLVDIKIKTELLGEVAQALQNAGDAGSAPLSGFLERATVDSAGFLAFRASEDGLDPYVPDEDDGTVPALYGKRYGEEQIAAWVKKYSEGGGRIVLHSVEGDGEAWGWEFDGKGRMRRLALCPIGKWQ